MRTAALAGGVLVAGGSATWLASISTPPTGVTGPQPEVTGSPEKISRTDLDHINVPKAVADRIGLRTVPVSRPPQTIPLPPFQARLALDNATLARVHSRFAGEVVLVGSSAANARPLQPNDTVKKGDLLAVVWSRDLGVLKSQLVDTITTLRSDEVTLQRQEDFYRTGGSERSVRDARQKVQADKNAVATAERSLRTARLTDDEIAAVRVEADKLVNATAPATGVDDWARVELRAPRDGVILEMNVSTGLMVDTTADLFKIGDLSHLNVWAHVFEDDVRLLTGLPKPVRWTVTLPSRPGVSFPGTLDSIAPVLDTNQQTALVTGRIDNPTGEFLIGQSATVTASVPAPADEIAVPAEAVIEDGRESLVFVQSPTDATSFTRLPVTVTRRTRTEIYLKTGTSPLRPGVRVAAAGALLLCEAMDGLTVAKDR
jgi:cobalt-zinc-cadmium efflux system membrane fusion protein